MPQIGSVWGSQTWNVNAWASNTWRDATTPPVPSFKRIPLLAGLAPMTISAGLDRMTLRASRPSAVLMAGLSPTEIAAGLTTLQIQAEREAMTILAARPSVSLKADAGEE